jgi:PIN domain nuclease of toxin-antitoxin system
VQILLDTQCWLWMVGASSRLSKKAAATLATPENELFLSAASVWEIAIKYALGKLRLPMEPAEYVRSRLALSQTAELPIHHRHAFRIASLPRHHRDPFDRMLIAQAQVENLRIMTADPQFAPYGVPTLST